MLQLASVHNELGVHSLMGWMQSVHKVLRSNFDDLKKTKFWFWFKKTETKSKIESCHHATQDSDMILC